MENALPTQDKTRLTVKEIKNEVLCHFYFEKGFLFTFYNMIRDPEKLISMYLNEDRRKVFNPFRYLLFGVAVATVILLSHPSFMQVMGEIQNGSAGAYETLEKQTNLPIWDMMIRMQEIYMSYQNVVVILSIPVVSLITWKFFKKHSFNYAENMAINSFVFGTTYWISAVLGLFTYFAELGLIMYMTTAISIIASTFLYNRIYKNGILRSFAGIIICYIPIIMIAILTQAIIFISLLLLH